MYNGWQMQFVKIDFQNTFTLCTNRKICRQACFKVLHFQLKGFVKQILL